MDEESETQSLGRFEALAAAMLGLETLAPLDEALEAERRGASMGEAGDGIAAAAAAAASTESMRLRGEMRRGDGGGERGAAAPSGSGSSSATLRLLDADAGGVAGQSSLGLTASQPCCSSSSCCSSSTARLRLFGGACAVGDAGSARGTKRGAARGGARGAPGTPCVLANGWFAALEGGVHGATAAAAEEEQEAREPLDDEACGEGSERCSESGAARLGMMGGLLVRGAEEMRRRRTDRAVRCSVGCR
jgi:hypothetical protein